MTKRFPSGAQLLVLTFVFSINSAMTHGQPAALAPDTSKPKTPTAKGLVVHEWGVLVKGNTKTPLLMAPNELITGLPEFVTLHENQYKTRKVYRPWNKPVIHFYGPSNIDIHVQLITAKGRPTAYFPKPELIEETFWSMGDGTIEAVGMTWKGKLTTDAPKTLPTVNEKHWWQTARTIPGLYFQQEKQSERFIFYEGTAHQAATIIGMVKDDTLTLINNDEAKSGRVLLIIADNGKRYLHTVESIEGRTGIELSRKQLMNKPTDEKAILDACRAQWRAFGMTADEAAAITDIWKDDLLQDTGFLMISRMPPRHYDAMFPLRITPQPEELVRVGMVFDQLGGQTDRAQWLTSLAKSINPLITQLGDNEFHKREAAQFKLRAFGDLASPFLNKATGSDDPEISNTARRLLKELEPKLVKPLPVHGPGAKPVHIKRTWKSQQRDR